MEVRKPFGRLLVYNISVPWALRRLCGGSTEFYSSQQRNSIRRQGDDARITCGKISRIEHNASSSNPFASSFHGRMSRPRIESRVTRAGKRSRRRSDGL